MDLYFNKRSINELLGYYYELSFSQKFFYVYKIFFKKLFMAKKVRNIYQFVF